MLAKVPVVLGLALVGMASLHSARVTTVGALCETAAMQARRAAHTATTLPDGRVLVVGGFTEPGPLPDAEIYAPARGHFAPAGPMRTVRHSHTATRLLDGRVLIAGGYGPGGDTLASVEIFDPRTLAFSDLPPLVTARANHVAVLLEDGRVLLAGGLGRGWSYLASAELFDPASSSFRQVGAMAVAREGHAAATLADGRVLVMGGHQGPRRALTLHATAEIFDPRARAFVPTGGMTVRRHKHDAVRLRDGRVLVTGGSDERDGDGAYASTETFDPVTGAFTAGPAMRRARYKHLGSSTVLADGRVLIAGGADVAELFDPRTRVFTEVAGSARVPGLFSAVARLGAGDVFVSGGYGRGQRPVSAAWIYRAAGGACGSTR